MSKNNYLIKNTIIITVGKFCTKFLSFFLLPLYTAILTTEDFGIVDLFNTSVIFIIPLLSFQIESAVFRYLIDARNNDEDKKVIISSATYFLLVMSGLLFIIYLIIQKILPQQYKVYLLLNMLAVMWSGYLFQLARGIGKTIDYAIGSFIVGSSTIIFNIIYLVLLNKGANGMFVAIFLANTLGIVFIIFKLRLTNYLRVSSIKLESLKSMLKYSIPLIPNSFAWWAISVSDRFIVSKILGVSANGILSIAHKFPTLISTFYGLFHMAWTESVTLNINEEDGEQYITETIIRVFKIFFSVVVMMLAFMPFVFPVMIKGSFSEAYTYIPLFACATMFDVIAGLVDPIYTAKLKTKSMMSATIIAGILNVIIHLILINFIGLWASAISSVVAYGFLVVYKYIDIQKYCKVKIPKKLVYQSLILLIIVSYSYYSKSSFIQLITLALCILYSILQNKGVIMGGVRSLSKKYNKSYINN